MIKKAIVLAIGCALAACATPQHNYVPEVEQFSRPDIGLVTTVGVGDEMLSQGNIVRRDGIEVPPNTSVSGYTLNGGFYPQTGQDEEYSYHSFMFGNMGPGSLSANFMMDPAQSIQAALDDSRLCVITVFNVHTCRERPFERTSQMNVNDNSFQQTLLYSGRVGNRVNISYREFSGNMARPAYSNDVEYDLDESNVIGYRGAQIEIIDASNTSITYRVLRNFNTP